MIDTSNKEIQAHYDFIVVGAGAAGSVLAAELSAAGAHVLLVESGGSDDAQFESAAARRLRRFIDGLGASRARRRNYDRRREIAAGKFNRSSGRDTVRR